MTAERRNVASLHAPPAYSHVAVATGRLVFTAGAVPLGAGGELVGGDDVRAQARQTIDNLLAQLAEGGATPNEVVKTTVYVVGADLIAVWDVVSASPLAGAPSTLLGVSRLGYEGQLVEIEAVAVVD